MSATNDPPCGGSADELNPSGYHTCFETRCTGRPSNVSSHLHSRL